MGTITDDNVSSMGAVKHEVAIHIKVNTLVVRHTASKEEGNVKKVSGLEGKNKEYTWMKVTRINNIKAGKTGKDYKLISNLNFEPYLSFSQKQFQRFFYNFVYTISI